MDGGGVATVSDSVDITVTDSGGTTVIHVQNQVVSRVKSRRWYWAEGTVLITDQNNHPVSRGRTTASYTGPHEGEASGMTDADGAVVLVARWTDKSDIQWCFTVTRVAKDGATYDAGANW